jgi:hypothetical protein
MDMPKQKANGMKKRVLPVHLLEILVCLAHLACLALLWWIQPHFDQVLIWVFVSLVIATAIPFGPVAGLASGLVLAIAERLVFVFQGEVPVSQIGPRLLDHLSANWTYLVIWPLAGLLAGLYATLFSRSSRRQARKAWELARINEQLKTKLNHYENRLNQGRPSGDWLDGRPINGYSPAQIGYLSYFLHEALALRTHTLTSLATRQVPNTLPETIFEVITESCPATIAIIDSRGMLLHSHHQVLAMFGFTADLTRPGRPFERLLTPDSAALMQTLISAPEQYAGG